MWEFTAADTLNWTPGCPGKGNVYSDGSIATWCIDNITASPHHQEQADYEHKQPAFLFYIDPDGGVHDGGMGYSNQTPEPDQNMMAKVLATDHRLFLAPANSPSTQPYEDFGHARNLLDTLSKVGAADPEWLRQHIEKNGPYAYHFTYPERVNEIRQQGVLPWDIPVQNPPGSAWEQDTFQPRPGHTYMTLLSDPTEREEKRARLAIDLRKLDPSRFMPDEDAAVTRYHLWDRELPGVQLNDPQAVETPRYPRGQWAADHDLRHPRMVEDSMYNTGGRTFAYRGSIPPEAIAQTALTCDRCHRNSVPVDAVHPGYDTECDECRDRINATQQSIQKQKDEGNPLYGTARRLAEISYPQVDMQTSQGKAAIELKQWLNGLAKLTQPDTKSPAISPHHRDELDIVPSTNEPLVQGDALDPPAHPWKPYNWATASVDDYEIRPADEGWFSHDTGNWIPRQMNGKDTLVTSHGQGDGRVAYFNGEPVASATWQQTPQGTMLGSAYTHPDHRGQGLFNRLTEDIRDQGPVDAYHWDNPWLKNKVRDWHTSNWEGFPFDERMGEGPRETDTSPERTPDGHFVLYHGTSPEGAQAIQQEQRIRPDDLNAVGLTSTPGAAQSFSAMKRGPIMRLVVDKDWLANHRATHEIGGSGHDQFLIQHDAMKPWEGVPPEAIHDIGVHRMSRIAEVIEPDADPVPCQVCGAETVHNPCDHCGENPDRPPVTDRGDDYQQMERNWYDRAWEEPGSPQKWPPEPQHWRQDNASDVTLASMEGKTATHRVCGTCREDKPASEFYRDKVNPSGLRGQCKDCVRTRSRDHKLQARYGLSPKEYDQLFKQQQGLCAICGNAEDPKLGRLSVDHCHARNVVRGLLCRACNRAIGSFGDDPETLEQAAQYLGKRRKKRDDSSGANPDSWAPHLDDEENESDESESDGEGGDGGSGSA